jgi:hypothetical protein
MKAFLLLVGGVAAIVFVLMLLLISSDAIDTATSEAVEDVISQLGDETSASAKQLSVNICTGLCIGSGNSKQDSAATTTTMKQEKEVEVEPPSTSSMLLFGLLFTVVVGLAVVFATFIFGSE